MYAQGGSQWQWIQGGGVQGEGVGDGKHVLARQGAAQRYCSCGHGLQVALTCDGQMRCTCCVHACYWCHNHSSRHAPVCHTLALLTPRLAPPRPAPPPPLPKQWLVFVDERLKWSEGSKTPSRSSPSLE